MAAKYEYQPHPSVKTRAGKHPANREKLGFNDKLGLLITKTVGTMWAAYAFVAIALLALPAVIANGDTLVIVAWVTQTFLQLVLLPVIIVGQNIQAKAAEARAIATYEDATALLHETKEIQQHLAAQDEVMLQLTQKLQQLEHGRKN